MTDPRISSSVLDVSKSAIRSALGNSDHVYTNILRLEPISANGPRELYLDFLRDSKGKNMEELIGFLPLQKVNTRDDKFILECQKHFSEGIPTPGLVFPIFGANNKGMCVSKRADTVFTVNEERIDYWILVCAVAYNKDKVKETLIFSRHPEMPHQAMKWDGGIDMRNGSAGWKRHFECINNILYVGELAGIGPCPRNVYPLAVAKVKFNSKNSKALEDVYIVEPPFRPMTRSNLILIVKELSCKKGQDVKSLFNKMHVNGVSLHSRYGISEEEWPLHLYFDSYATLSHVFTSWIVKGKLNIVKLLNEGNVKMPASLFYDHSHKICSKTHPEHLYLNYYEVSPPKEEKKMMITRLVDLDHRGMIIFSCVPQVTRSGHSLYAGVPPGETANRLGLPTIEPGRFHLIHAMPVPKGTYEKVDRRKELEEIFASDPFARNKIIYENCRSTTEVIELSSDSDEEEERSEESIPPSHQQLRPVAVTIPTVETIRETALRLQRLKESGLTIGDRSNEDMVVSSSTISSSLISLHPSDQSSITTESPSFSLHGVPPPPPCPPPPPSPRPSHSPPHSHQQFSSPATFFNERPIPRLSMDSGLSRLNQKQQPPSQSIVIPSQRREEEEDDYDPCDMDVSDGESGENAVVDRRKSVENRMETFSLEDRTRTRDESIENREEERSKGRRDYEKISGEKENGFDEEERPSTRLESPARERRPSSCVNWTDDEEENEVECITLSPPRSSTISGGFRPLKTSAAKKARTTRIASRDESLNDDMNERREFLVWNRMSKGAENKSFSRFPPCASIIVVDDELFKQTKLQELNKIIKRLNVLSTDDQKRMLVVVHDDFDANKLMGMNPSILFIMDHKGENSNEAKVKCCDRVRRMGGRERVEMIYLSPNINRDLPKNRTLTDLGFNVLSRLGMENQLESRQYDEDY